MHWQWFDNWCVRDGDWKLQYNKKWQKANGSPYFLGSLSGEHPEADNLADQHPEVVERLKKAHETWAVQVQPKKKDD